MLRNRVEKFSFPGSHKSKEEEEEEELYIFTIKTLRMVRDSESLQLRYIFFQKLHI